MGVNKVEFGDETLIDLTEDTVTPETLTEGVTAHDASGEKITGTLNLGIYQTKTDENLETESKEVTGAINELLNTITGTTWEFYDNLNGATGVEYEFNFTSNGEVFSGIKNELTKIAVGGDPTNTIEYCELYYRLADSEEYMLVYDGFMQKWENTYKIIYTVATDVYDSKYDTTLSLSRALSGLTTKKITPIDNRLNTKSKSVVGAINELYGSTLILAGYVDDIGKLWEDESHQSPVYINVGNTTMVQAEMSIVKIVVDLHTKELIFGAFDYAINEVLKGTETGEWLELIRQTGVKASQDVNTAITNSDVYKVVYNFLGQCVSLLDRLGEWIEETDLYKTINAFLTDQTGDLKDALTTYVGESEIEGLDDDLAVEEAATYNLRETPGRKKTIVGALNNLNNRLKTDAQHKTDENLSTADKTVIGAINEVNDKPHYCSQGLTYTLSEDKTYYTVSGVGTCMDTEVIIPAVYKGRPVTNIGQYAFVNCTWITKVTLPNSINTITGSAFSGCTALEYINIPKGVTFIGYWAFLNCSSAKIYCEADTPPSSGWNSYWNPDNRPVVYGCKFTFGELNEKINSMSGGESSPSAKAIIDVVELPTESIDENSFYRLLTAKWVTYGEVYNSFTCYCIDRLPAFGEVATTDMVTITTYYHAPDNSVYGYVDDTLGGYFGIPAGWYHAEMLFQAAGIGYGGVITNIEDSNESGDFKVLLGYTLYTCKDGKLEAVKGVGSAGTGVEAVSFNRKQNEATGDYATAIGDYTKAKGRNSLAEGECTVATARNQHAQGQYNIEDTEEKYLHIVGNGYDGAPSNAHTIDREGNGWFAGDIKVGGTGQDDPNAKVLATKEYVDSKLGGDSAQSLIGTWTIIENPEIPTGDLPLEFTADGVECTAIGTTSMGSSSWGINALSYQAKDGGYYVAAYTNNPSGSYGITHGWGNEANKYITVTKEPEDKNTIKWLGNNTDAPKIEFEEDTFNGFEMPQIRFTSATGSTENETPMLYVDADNPLKLTVEIVGGGALQVGDQLQVCIRKRFSGSASNGFRRKYKLQRFAEYIVTEEDLDNKYLTVLVACKHGSADKMLHHSYRGLFHDGKAGEIAPLYLRIRRAKGNMQNNDSGQSVDADFSNTVTIWKHSIRGAQSIRIQ